MEIREDNRKKWLMTSRKGSTVRDEKREQLQKKKSKSYLSSLKSFVLPWRRRRTKCDSIIRSSSTSKSARSIIKRVAI